MSAENKKGEFLMKRFTVVLSIVLLSMSGLFAAAINSPAATVYLTKTTVISMDQLNAKVKSYQDAYTAQGQDPTKVDTMDVLNTMVNDELFRQGAARDKVIITDSMIDQAYNQVKSQYNAAGATDDQFVQVINRTYGSIQAYPRPASRPASRPAVPVVQGAGHHQRGGDGHRCGNPDGIPQEQGPVGVAGEREDQPHLHSV
jgi:hypothetical protein